MLALLAVHPRQLRGRRRLARALQAHQHDDGGRVRCHGQPMPAAAQQLDQLVVNNFHHLLRWRQRFEDILTDRFLAHAVYEPAHDLEVDVGLQQRHADLAQRLLDVVLAQPAAPAEAVEDRLQSCAQGVQHWENAVYGTMRNISTRGRVRRPRAARFSDGRAGARERAPTGRAAARSRRASAGWPCRARTHPRASTSASPTAGFQEPSGVSWSFQCSIRVPNPGICRISDLPGNRGRRSAKLCPGRGVLLDHQRRSNPR